MDFILNLQGEEKRLAERKFQSFKNLLLENNEKFNLTAITDEREIEIKHFFDSLQGEALIPPFSRVAEIGSGAGFPSVPLKIVRGDLDFTLIEATKKKCSFLEEAGRTLGFENFRVVAERAEEVGKKEDFREKFDVVLARAVARLPSLAEYALPLVRLGGIFLAYKGRADEEMEEAKHAITVLGGTFLKEKKYSLPFGEGERSILVYKKISPTPAKYPRGRGKERSAPL